jgi:hypothetical protein
MKGTLGYLTHIIEFPSRELLRDASTFHTLVYSLFELHDVPLCLLALEKRVSNTHRYHISHWFCKRVQQGCL